MDDAAIHRVSGDAGGVVCSGSEGQWIATGYALAMTKVVGAWCLSLRGGTGVNDSAIHRVLGDAAGLSVRLLRAIGSPRAAPSR